jgi:5-enolpyruvylshikimate-3-phosphate synthase
VGKKHLFSSVASQIYLHLPLSQDAQVYVADAGTAARFLAALACLRCGPTTLRGSARMHERPMADLFAALSASGANITCLNRPGHLPARFAGSGGPLHRFASSLDEEEHCLPGQAVGLAGGEMHVGASVSSQFASALLMVAPFAQRSVA